MKTIASILITFVLVAFTGAAADNPPTKLDRSTARLVIVFKNGQAQEIEFIKRNGNLATLVNDFRQPHPNALVKTYEYQFGTPPGSSSTVGNGEISVNLTDLSLVRMEDIVR